MATAAIRSNAKALDAVRAKLFAVSLALTALFAGAAAFLASEEGQWITNEKIRCDGGVR